MALEKVQAVIKSGRPLQDSFKCPGKKDERPGCGEIEG
jgi:hypothetical protein